MVQRADESVAFAIFCRRHWRLRLNDRVDTANCGEGQLKAGQALFSTSYTPRWATSVAISKRMWFFTSRGARSPPSLDIVEVMKRFARFAGSDC